MENRNFYICSGGVVRGIGSGYGNCINTAISAAYFRAKDGKTQEAEDMAKEYFEILLKLSKGDFETRLWLFYDAYMYGKTMELCGNKNEAIRGYRECIKANPHTDLAQKSTASPQRLNGTVER